VTGPLRAGVGVVRFAQVQRLGRQRRLDDQYAVRRQKRLEPRVVHLFRFLDLPLVIALGGYSMLIFLKPCASHDDSLAVCRHSQSLDVKIRHVELQLVPSTCTFMSVLEFPFPRFSTFSFSFKGINHVQGVERGYVCLSM